MIITEINEILGDLSTWENRCHEASLKLVQNGIGDRVARGVNKHVAGQHSWVVCGDPYKPSLVIDPTLHFHMDSMPNHVYVGSPRGHIPQGAGSIWQTGQPVCGGGDIIRLTPAEPLSADAKVFLSLVEPLDRQGWCTLIHSPVGGWPASEIIAAVDDTAALSALVPIDILGMITDRNPEGLYLRK